MKVANGEILQAKPVVEQVLQLPADKLTWKGKYFLAKLGRKLSGPLTDIETIRQKLVEQYGQKTEQGYEVKGAEALVSFRKDFAEVLDIETEVDWSPVMLSDKDAEALTGGQMMELDRFISFPEPGENPSAVAGDGVVKDAEAVLNGK